MSIRLEDIPSIHNALRARSGGSYRRGPRLHLDRRGFMKAVGAAGMTAGLWAIGNLPPTRRALASHAGQRPYRILQSCNGHSCYNQGNQGCGDGSEGPCCPSTVFPNACVGGGDGQPHFVGWHKNAQHGYSNWDVRPDDCVANQKDGWKWWVNSTCGPCVGCSKTEFRCHDGFRVYSGGGIEASVCKWAVACGQCGGGN